MGVNKVTPKRILFVGLTLEFQKESPEKYEYRKIRSWQNIIQNGMKPVKWLKPNKNGTPIHFEMIKDIEEWEKASQELKAYVDEFNKTYNKTGSVED